MHAYSFYLLRALADPQRCVAGVAFSVGNVVDFRLSQVERKRLQKFISISFREFYYF